MQLFVVAGAPGAGKSTVADLLAPALRPVPALLDKDTLYSGFVGEVQAAHGRPPGEREGSWYDAHVKVHEYAGLTAATRQIRRLGASVMVVAPFTLQIRDPTIWAEWLSELGGDPVHLIWVRTDADTLRARLTSRGLEADGGKLANFEAFVERMRPDETPPVPHHRVDNAADAEPLSAQLTRLAATLSSPAPALR